MRLERDRKIVWCRGAWDTLMYSISLLFCWLEFHGKFDRVKKCSFNLYLVGIFTLVYLSYVVLRGLGLCLGAGCFSKRPRAHYGMATVVVWIGDFVLLLGGTIFATRVCLTTETVNCAKKDRVIRSWWRYVMIFTVGIGWLVTLCLCIFFGCLIRLCILIKRRERFEEIVKEAKKVPAIYVVEVMEYLQEKKILYGD